jgi:polyphosphate kinase
VFGTQQNAQVYLASADLMTRNTERRVETACPILDENLRKRILDMLQIQMQDNVKARNILPDGSLEPIVPDSGDVMDSQEYFIQEAHRNAPVYPEKRTGLRKLHQLIRGRFRLRRKIRRNKTKRGCRTAAPLFSEIQLIFESLCF